MYKRQVLYSAKLEGASTDEQNNRILAALRQAIGAESVTAESLKEIIDALNKVFADAGTVDGPKLIARLEALIPTSPEGLVIRLAEDSKAQLDPNSLAKVDPKSLAKVEYEVEGSDFVTNLEAAFTKGGQELTTAQSEALARIKTAFEDGTLTPTEIAAIKTDIQTLMGPSGTAAEWLTLSLIHI